MFSGDNAEEVRIAGQLTLQWLKRNVCVCHARAHVHMRVYRKNEKNITKCSQVVSLDKGVSELTQKLRGDS